jgi:hypothetical protein
VQPGDRQASEPTDACGTPGTPPMQTPPPKRLYALGMRCTQQLAPTQCCCMFGSQSLPRACACLRTRHCRAQGPAGSYWGSYCAMMPLPTD